MKRGKLTNRIYISKALVENLTLLIKKFIIETKDF